MHMRWTRSIDAPVVHADPGRVGVAWTADVELATVDVTPGAGASAGHSDAGSSAQLVHAVTTTTNTSATVTVR